MLSWVDPYYSNAFLETAGLQLGLILFAIVGSLFMMLSPKRDHYYKHHRISTLWIVSIGLFIAIGYMEEHNAIGVPKPGAVHYTPDCSDFIDNDSDGLADHPDDPGCDSNDDSDEQS